MASKATITASIDTINNGGANTAAEVRAVFETLNTELFTPDAYAELVTFSTGFTLNLLIQKIGALVILHGVVENTTSGILSLPTTAQAIPAKYAYTNTIALEGRIPRNAGVDFSYLINSSGITFDNGGAVIVFPSEVRRFSNVYFNNNNL
jgi:hypothetical protein